MSIVFRSKQVKHTVKTLLFVVDKCLWLFRYLLPPNLPPPRTLKAIIFLVCIKIIQISYPTKLRSNKPGNRGYLRTLTPTNKSVSTVHSMYYLHSLFRWIQEHKHKSSRWPGLYKFHCFHKVFFGNHLYLKSVSSTTSFNTDEKGYLHLHPINL